MSIQSGTFAEACFDNNSIQELKNALLGSADRADMVAWNLTATEWKEQIALALNEKQMEKNQ